MNKVQYIRYEENQILVRFEGIHRNIIDEPEKVTEILEACKDYNNDPTEDKGEKIINLLNPVSREDFTDSLEIDDRGRIYLKGTKTELPSGLANLIKIYLDDGTPIDSLINFWKLCLSNPNATARDGFFAYVKKYGIVITDNGYAIMYKAMNVDAGENKIALNKSVDEQLSRFIGAEFLRIKGQKKSPKNYEVFKIYNHEEGSIRYAISKHTGAKPDIEDEEDIEENLGTLQEMHEKIQEEGAELEESTDDIAVYKPSHTGSHGMSAKLGTPVTMPREQCDPNINISCSYGLHVGSYKYVKSFGSGMDAILAVLVNPRDVVALPKSDDSKIRVCEYFPYAEVRRTENGDWEELEHGFFEEDFLNYEKEEIEKELTKLYEEMEPDSEKTDREVVLNERLVDIKP